MHYRYYIQARYNDSGRKWEVEVGGGSGRWKWEVEVGGERRDVF